VQPSDAPVPFSTLTNFCPFRPAYLDPAALLRQTTVIISNNLEQFFFVNDRIVILRQGIVKD
jgi:hypothetical protein